MLERLAKPWYVYRPQQLFRNLFRRWNKPKNSVLQVRLPWSMVLEIDTQEDIGRSIWQTGIYDLAVTEVLYRLIREQDLVLDVGANIGYMTSVMSYRAGKTGEVIAFEPHPLLLTRLQRNILHFQQHPSAASVTVCQMALSDANGQGQLGCPRDFLENQGTASLTSGGESAEVFSVPMACLDDVLEGRRPGIMKVDVEGHELEVFRGGIKTLRCGGVRHIVYEDHRGPNGPTRFFLSDQGYQIYQIGWSLRGPVLAGLDEPSICRSYEAPSYLATSQAAEARTLLSPRGWRCLRTASSTKTF